MVKYGENFYRFTLAVLHMLRNAKHLHGVWEFDLLRVLRDFGVLQKYRAFWHRLLASSTLASDIALHEDVVLTSTSFQPTFILSSCQGLKTQLKLAICGLLLLRVCLNHTGPRRLHLEHLSDPPISALVFQYFGHRSHQLLLDEAYQQRVALC